MIDLAPWGLLAKITLKNGGLFGRGAYSGGGLIWELGLNQSFTVSILIIYHINIYMKSSEDVLLHYQGKILVLVFTIKFQYLILLRLLFLVFLVCLITCLLFTC